VIEITPPVEHEPGEPVAVRRRRRFMCDLAAV
jgi:hypothetical protein